MYTDAEVEVLIKGVEDHEEILSEILYFSHAAVDKNKMVWDSITERVNAMSTTIRTVEQIRSKWLHLVFLVDEYLHLGIDPIPFHDRISKISWVR